MGRSQRQKGKRGERATASELREALPAYAEDIRRGWQTRQGDDDPDVILPGFWLENKSGKQPNVRAALKQAVEDSKGRGVPLAVIRDDRKEPFCVMRWSDMLDLLKKVMPDAGSSRGNSGGVRGATGVREGPGQG